jgi:uncharacterized protein
MILIESWAWIALADKSDPYQRKAKAAHKKFRRTARSYVTTDDILGETITYLFDAIGAIAAQGFINTVLSNADLGIYRLVSISQIQFRRAWDMRQRYRDKPDISFVDFTSMVVMQDLGITDVFTGDAHFQQVNLGFRLHP